MMVKTRVILLAALIAAGSAWAHTHEIGSGAELTSLLRGQAVNGHVLADGDTIAVTNDFTTTAAGTFTKRVTLRSAAGGPVRTIFLGNRHTFQIDSAVTMEHLTIDGTNAVRCTGAFTLPTDGGALTLDAGATIRNVNCMAASDWPDSYHPIKVAHRGATLTLNDGSLIANCSSQGNGGAIYNSSDTGDGNQFAGKVRMTGGTISGCRASRYGSGGAIYVGYGDSSDGANVTISGGTIIGCSAYCGGGVYSGAGYVTISGGTITNCTAYNAFAIYSDARYLNSSNRLDPSSYRGLLTLSGGTICGNYWNGGSYGTECFPCAVFLECGLCHISGSCTITSNVGDPQWSEHADLSTRLSIIGGLVLTGDLTGSVGVLNPWFELLRNPPEYYTEFSEATGIWFAYYQAGNGAGNFYYNLDPTLRGRFWNGFVRWAKGLAGIQRYPWNNLVDIDYLLRDDATNARLVFTATDETSGQTVTMRTFRDNADTNRFVTVSGTPALRTAGWHRITWDANADGVATLSTNVTYRLQVYAGLER